jgi:hypothetical protein
MAGAKRSTSEVIPLPVAQLSLDQENPRLPESLVGAAEDDILAYALEDLVLEELAESFLENGFFWNEPLSVMKKSDRKNPTEYVVLEGNRRLAALRILLRDRVPENLALDLAYDPDPKDLKRLETIPCVVAKDRSEVNAMIGFRHIGGLKKWESEAKARYIFQRIEELVEANEPEPFKELGRRIGSNAQGVRNPYIALAIARWARNECRESELPRVNRLMQKSRFGVWQRTLNSKEVRSYIGYTGGTTYNEIQSCLRGLKKNKLMEVIKDLTPSTPDGRPLVRDSRYITDYGRVIANPNARAALRESNDLDVARQLVDQAELADRLRKLQQQIRRITDEVSEKEVVDEEAVLAAKALEKVVRVLRTTIVETFDGSM